MISMKTRIDDRQFFFDRKAVIQATDNATRMVLSKTGALARRRIINSIKPTRLKNLNQAQRRAYKIAAKANKMAGLPKPKIPVVHSQPGEPPRSITGKLKQNIGYRYRPDTKSVIFGPELFGYADIATAVLEFGGATYSRSRVRNGGTRSRGRSIKARPYVRPVAARMKQQLPSLWAEARAKFGQGVTRKAIK